MLRQAAIRATATPLLGERLAATLGRSLSASEMLHSSASQAQSHQHSDHRHSSVQWAFPPAAHPFLTVKGHTELHVPIRRVFCVGRNYADHAREMGSCPEKEPPFFFAKPADAVVCAPKIVRYPSATSNLHFEVEQTVLLKAGGENIRVRDAAQTVYGLGVGIDFTRRDMQDEAKKNRRPWDMSKARGQEDNDGFDQSAVCSPITPIEQVPDAMKGGIWLKLNGVEKQRSDVSFHIWNIPETARRRGSQYNIAYLSTLVRLEPGDLIFMGTPSGVGAVERGDTVEAVLDGVATLNFKME